MILIQKGNQAEAVPVFIAWRYPFNKAGLSRGRVACDRWRYGWAWRYPVKPWR